MITTRPRPLYPRESHYFSIIHYRDNWLKPARIREVPGSKLGQNTDYPFAANAATATYMKPQLLLATTTRCLFTVVQSFSLIWSG